MNKIRNYNLTTYPDLGDKSKAPCNGKVITLEACDREGEKKIHE